MIRLREEAGYKKHPIHDLHKNPFRRHVVNNEQTLFHFTAGMADMLFALIYGGKGSTQ